MSKQWVKIFALFYMKHQIKHFKELFVKFWSEDYKVVKSQFENLLFSWKFSFWGLIKNNEVWKKY